MSFENKTPMTAKKSGEEESSISVSSLREELADDYKNFKDPNFYFPGGKSELEKKILEKEDQLRSLEASNVVADLRKELADDYKNFKDPNFYFPGGKEELEKIMLEKEDRLRLFERIKNGEKVVDSIKEEPVAPGGLSGNSAPENIGAYVHDFMMEKSGERASELLDDYSEPVEASIPVEQGSEQEDEEGDKEIYEEMEEGDQVEQETEDKQRRGRIFEFIRKHPKLRWAVAAAMITAIGFGIFKATEGSQGGDKKIDKKEILKPGTEPDDSEVPVIDINEEIIRLKKTKLEKSGVDISEISPEALKVIFNNIGEIEKVVILEPVKGLKGNKWDAVGKIEDYKMHNSEKVTFIDGCTGETVLGEAISMRVHSGDYIIKDKKGNFFVICFKGLQESGKSSLDKTAKSGGVDNAGVSTKSTDDLKTTPAEALKAIPAEDPSKASVETPVQSSANTPANALANSKVEPGSALDNPIDLSGVSRKTAVEAEGDSQGDSQGVDELLNEDTLKVKKGFWRKIFGGKTADENQEKLTENNNSKSGSPGPSLTEFESKTDSVDVDSFVADSVEHGGELSGVNNFKEFFYKDGKINEQAIRDSLGEDFSKVDIKLVRATPGGLVPYFDNPETNKAAKVLLIKDREIVLVETLSLSSGRSGLRDDKNISQEERRRNLDSSFEKMQQELGEILTGPTQITIEQASDGTFSIEAFKRVLGRMIL